MICGAVFDYFFISQQKTAYEMRISDWSSDVCSSDLPGLHPVDSATSAILNGIPRSRRRSSSAITRSLLLFISTVNGSSCGCLRLCGLSRHVFGLEDLLPVSSSHCWIAARTKAIGRVSCRERVWRYG